MKFVSPLLSLSLATLIAGCATPATDTDASEVVAAPAASATLLAPDGAARGTASVIEASDGLRVKVIAAGLAPGVHAVHVHTTGLCTPPDFTSAGGHWNPTSRQHGKDNPAGKHMGDMPNLIAGADGRGELEYLIPAGRLASGATPLLDADGAAVVIHAAPDDNRSDPAGNAGGRIACGALSLS